MQTLYITPSDNRYTVRETLRRIHEKTILVVLSWDVEKEWNQTIDYEVLLREAQQREQELIWVVEDPERRPVVRAAGFAVYNSEEAALEFLEIVGTFPQMRKATQPQRPPHAWWKEEPKRPKLPLRRRQPAWLISLEIGVLLVALAAVGVTTFLSLPSAHIVLVPQGITYSRVVKVSVDPDLDDIDLERGVVPTRRIGDEFEKFVEVSTTGRGISFSGRARGTILFTNLLDQNYQVPAGTIMRTTAGSYPVRYATTQLVEIPAFGQASVTAEALEEGPQGNIRAYQINLVEGVAGFAVRVTNPDPIGGAESSTVATVSEADHDRAWDLAAQQVIADAYNGLLDSSYLEPGEFLPQQELIIQAVPKQAFTHLVGERAQILGLSLRLLISGQTVSLRDTQAVAYQQLSEYLPADYSLTDARFEYGEAAEEDVGPGLFTFYVTTYGYANADIDTSEAQDMIQGQSLQEAIADLNATYLLAQPPEITVKPAWFPYIPFLPIRTEIEIIPANWAD